MNIKSCFLAAALLGWSALAQTPSAEAPATQAGIQVHGVWTIQVFEPDGTEVSTKTFDNALVGASALTGFLNAEVVSGGGYLVLETATGSAGPCNGPCHIGTSALNAGITFQATNLVTSSQGTNFETLQMVGSVTASSNETIGAVASWFCVCNAATNTATQCTAQPDSCGVFTRKVLASGIAVTAGQIVQVTLEITFS